MGAVFFVPITGRPQNQPKLGQVRAGQGTLTLEWSGESEFYEVQAATQLVNPDWRTVLRVSATSGTVFTSGSAAFFRVLTLPNWTSRIVDTDRRLTILKAITQKTASLSPTNAANDAEALVQFLSSFPELEGVQRTPDNSVAAYFTDGRPLVIVRNRRGATPSELAQKYPLTTSDRVTQMAHPVTETNSKLNLASHSSLALPSSQAPTAIPQSQRAVLFEASLPGLLAPMLESLIPAFQKRGYSISGGEPSLANLLAIQDFGNDIGVFYIDTHGVIGSATRTQPGLSGPGVLAPVPSLFLSSSTIPTAKTEAAYAPNFARSELGYMVGEPDEETGEVDVYYGISPEFVRNHWQFSRSSLVFMDACHSASAGANSFIRACWDKNASLYVGWSDSVIDAWAYFASRVFFDTSLGGSQMFPDVMPKQRAFDWPAILKYMRSKNYEIDQHPNSHGAKLLFVPDPFLALPASFGMLAPSIRQMDTGTEPGQVIIEGLFDPELPATVRVEGGALHEFEVTPRSATQLAVPWPGTSQPSAGGVTVLQNGHPSNRVPLSEWRIPAQLVRPFSGAVSQPSANIDLDLHVRADLHPTRLVPYGDSVFIAKGAVAAADSTAVLVSANGQYDDGRLTVEWQLPAPVELDWRWYFSDLNGTAFKARVTFAGAGVVKFEALVAAHDKLKVISTTKDGQRSEFPGDAAVSAYPNTQGFLNEAYGILSGDDSSNPGAIAFGHHFSWGAAAAASAPDPNQADYAE